MRACILEPDHAILEASGRVRDAVEALLKHDADGARRSLAALDASSIQAHWAAGRRLVRLARAGAVAPGRSSRASTSATIRHEVFARDGYRCRYCGILVLDRRARQVLNERFPDEFPHRSNRIGQHHPLSGVVTASHDHVVPLRAGGANAAGNLVTACYVCQFLKGQSTLEVLGLADPRLRPPVPGWDGGLRLLSLRPA